MMAIRTVSTETAALPLANGGAMAAFLGTGIGAFTMGVMVLRNEAAIFVAPTLYAPAGRVTGRTTLATIVWLMAWGLLHRRWNAREMASGRIYALTLFLVALGILGTFPPIW